MIRAYHQRTKTLRILPTVEKQTRSKDALNSLSWICTSTLCLIGLSEVQENLKMGLLIPIISLNNLMIQTPMQIEKKLKWHSLKVTNLICLQDLLQRDRKKSLKLLKATLLSARRKTKTRLSPNRKKSRSLQIMTSNLSIRSFNDSSSLLVTL